MIRVIFIDRAGKRRECEASDGMTMLELAHENDIDIEGICGGSLACATCHLHIAEEWFSRLPEAREDELDMMELAHDRIDRSRLGCQISLNEDLDGLVVSLPKKEF